MAKTSKNLFDKKKNLWGIDMGGTKLEGAVLKTAKDPSVLFRTRLPTGADQGYEHILSQTKKLVDAMVDAAGYKPAGIGIGTPGVHDPILGTMKNCNSVAMNGKPMKADLEEL